MSKELIRLSGIDISFDGEAVLKSLDLSIKNHEFVTLLGPSGCGKTTTLRIIGGFLTPQSGSVYFDGKDITNLPPYKRNVNTVFQKYALFPHLNIYENIAFGLRIKKWKENDIREAVASVLKTVNLEGYEKRDVTTLSGGQQQRIAIARALVNRPQVLLLDEPLGALDLKLRKEMQVELKHIQQQTGITFVYVTHDQEEALTMSDTVVVMNKGIIQQIGTPEDIYNEPANAFVADFIGEANIIDGVMPEDRVVHFCGQTVPCVDGGFEKDEAVDVVLRPEDIKLVPVERAQFTGVITELTFKGVHYEMIVHSACTDFIVHSTLCEPIGTEVGLFVAPNDIHIMRKLPSEASCAREEQQ